MRAPICSEQQGEAERCQRRQETRRHAEQAQAIAVVLPAEQDERHHAARDGDDAIARAVKQREGTRCHAAAGGDRGTCLVVKSDSNGRAGAIC